MLKRYGAKNKCLQSSFQWWEMPSVSINTLLFTWLMITFSGNINELNQAMFNISFHKLVGLQVCITLTFSPPSKDQQIFNLAHHISRSSIHNTYFTYTRTFGGLRWLELFYLSYAFESWWWLNWHIRVYDTVHERGFHHHHGFEAWHTPVLNWGT